MKKIIIVEDDETTRKVIGAYIKKYTQLENTEIIFFEAAEETYQTIKTNDFQIICFIIDVGLPGIKNGIELYKNLRGLTKYRNIPTLIMSVDTENIKIVNREVDSSASGVVKNAKEHLNKIIEFAQESFNNFHKNKYRENYTEGIH